MKIRFILPVIAVSLACSANGLAAESYDGFETKEEVQAMVPVEQETFSFLIQRAMSAQDTDKLSSDDAKAFCGANVNVGDIHQFELLSNISSEINQVIPDDFNRCGNAPFLGCQNIQARKTQNVKTVKFHANVVSITFVDGYAFHVADYFCAYGNSRIVTCLNGELVGRQGIADNGILRIESTNVEWYDNYFIHHYPGGIVTSYENSQTFEVYQ